MSLEFAVQYSCPLRASYSERHLRDWGRLSSLHAKLTTGDASAPSIDKLNWGENARDEIERMQEATTVCARCPACLPLEAAGEGEAFWWLGPIHHPIPIEFRKFFSSPPPLPPDSSH